MDDPGLRASDAERERAVAALRAHLLAGRLTSEEFAERVDAALRARVSGDLQRLQADLPAADAGPTGSRLRSARFAVALLGHVVRRGRMRLPGWAFAMSALGDLDFDLREATVAKQRTIMPVLAALGNVDIYLPEGVNVEVSGLAILGHRRDWGLDTGRPHAPVVQVLVLGVAGTVDVWRVPADMRGYSYSEIFRRLGSRRSLAG